MVLFTIRQEIFTVLRFEISNNSRRDIFYDTAAQTAKVPYIALYLERPGTRNIIFTEAPASSLLGSAVVNTIESSTYPLAPMNDQLWMESIFKPERMTKTIVSHQVKTVASPVSGSPNTSSATVSANSSSITNLVQQQEAYTAYYYDFGYNVADTITIQENTTEPNGPATATGQLCVAGWDWNETELNGTPGPDLINKMTNWEIGPNNISSGNPGTAGITMSVPAPDAIQSVSGSARWTSTNGFSINWALSYNAPYTPLNATLVWPSQATSGTSSGSASLTWYPVNNAGEAPWYLNGNQGNYIQMYSTNPSQPSGDVINAGFQLDQKTASSSTSATYEIEYIYDIQSGPQNNTTDWGEQVDPFSWTANPTA